MNTHTYLTITGSIFCLVAVIHLARLIFGWEVTISNWQIPLWFSGIGMVGALILGYFGLRLSK